MRVFCNISWWALLAAATVGAVRKPAQVPLAAIAAVALVTIVTFGVGRFHAPLVPLVCVLTSRCRGDGACYRRRS